MDDLVSRSALKDSFCEACSTNKRYHLTNEECRSKTNALYGYGCFKMRLIDNAPPIDAEPVQHGEWITTKIIKSFGTLNGFKCSLCGKEWVTRNNYCPNCGADMRGGKDAAD